MSILSRLFGGRQSRPKSGASAPPASAPQVAQSWAEKVSLVNRGLEIGLCNDKTLDEIYADLDSDHQSLLPELGPALAETAFLLWKSRRAEFAKRLLFSSLHWSLNSPSADPRDTEALIQNIEHIYTSEGRALSRDDIVAWTRFDNFRGSESWRLDVAALRDGPQEVTELVGSTLNSERVRYSSGFTASVHAQLPLTTFRGWLKRTDPLALGANDSCVIETLFPMFGERSAQREVDRTEELLAAGIQLSRADREELAAVRRLLERGSPAELRRHRRFAGGDGLLPRGCYSSVCDGEHGNDCGTLSRELLAYVDTRVPGIAYVGDSTSARLRGLFGNDRERSGSCAVYILLIPPTDPGDLQLFERVYEPALNLMPIVTDNVRGWSFDARVDECEVDRVVDLRLPNVQRWFFSHFKNGDGHFLLKEAGSVTEFYDLLPTLMNATLGGTNVTHAIGSWMRSSGVNGLIFPSARSNAAATISDGQLAEWHGWNFLDYRTATALPATEVTRSSGGWPNFEQQGVQVAVAYSGRLTGSWKISGLQVGYDFLTSIIERSPAGSAAASAASAHARSQPHSATVQDLGPTS